MSRHPSGRPEDESAASSTSGEPPFAQPVMPGGELATDLPAVKLTASGAIDEDIYCLECGYNLRGLAGDPVRCPECGVDNPVSLALLPAADIRSAFRRLETAPSLAVGATALGSIAVFLWLAILLPNRLELVEGVPCLLMVVVPAIATGIVAYRWLVGTTDIATARRILRLYHGATLLMSAPMILGVLLLVIFEPVSYRWMSGGAETIECWVWGAAAATSFFLAALGLRMYANANRLREDSQRETAVRIAQEVFRRRLHWSRVRSGLRRGSRLVP